MRDQRVKATHGCAGEHCQRTVPLHLLMCIEHWRMVPAPLRREILRSHRATQLAPTGATALAELMAYRAAVDQAVAAVATKEQNKTTARTAAQGGDLFGAEQRDSDGNDSSSTRHIPARGGSGATETARRLR